MKCLLYTCLFFLIDFSHCDAQRIIVNKTRFIGGDSCYTNCRNALGTRDGGILFTGATYCSAKGDIPFTPYLPHNVVIGKYKDESIAWIKVFGGANGESGEDVCEALDGGYIILAGTGSSDGDAAASGNKGTWLLKLDEQGNKLWDKFYGIPFNANLGTASGFSIACTPDSGFIILGGSTGSGYDIPFHYGNSQFIFDWFVIKTNKLGNIQWINVYGGENDENSQGSILVANNGYYIVGSSDSKSYDCTDTTWHSSSVNTGYDYFIVKLDTAGKVLWSRSYGGSKADIVTDAILDDKDSSIVVTGYSSSTDYMVEGGHGKDDMWVMKADKDGDFIWGRMCGGKEDDNIFQAVSKASNGGYLASTQSNFSTLGKSDIWLFALDTAGNIETEKVIGGTDYDYPTSIIANQDRFAIIGGSTSQFFTEGNNIGRKGLGDEIFITEFYYFPTFSFDLKTEDKKLQIYPNPARQQVTIDIPRLKKKEKGVLAVYDINSKQVFSTIVYNKDKQLIVNTEKWPAGLYYLILRANDGIYAEKLLHY